MRTIAILLCLCAAGCDEKVVNATEVPQVTDSKPVTVAECKPFDLGEWPRDVDLSSPEVTFTAPASIFGWEIQAGPDWGNSGHALENYPREKGYRWTVRNFFEHDHVYRIRGRVGACWSNWQEFRVGPANPDASNSARPAPSRAVVEWSQCQGSDPAYRFVLSATFVPPFAGPYQLTVMTEDELHRTGYQVGAPDVLKMETDGFVAFTPDIPDDQTQITQTWEGLSGPIRFTYYEGSVHRVCVTVRQ